MSAALGLPLKIARAREQTRCGRQACKIGDPLNLDREDCEAFAVYDAAGNDSHTQKCAMKGCVKMAATAVASNTERGREDSHGICARMTALHDHRAPAP